MLFTQHGLIGGLVILNMFGYAMGRSGVQRFIRHNHPAFSETAETVYFQGNAFGPIPMTEALALFWAHHLIIMGLLSFSVPLLITMFLISRGHLLFGWISMLLFSFIYWGSGVALWVGSIYYAL